MKKKLFDKIVRYGYYRTNRFEYRVIAGEIWKCSTLPGSRWKFDRRIYRNENR